MDTATRRPIAPRPSPLHLVGPELWDEFLADGDFGLSVGGGHFPAWVIERVTGSPYCHVVGLRRLGGTWYLIESAPPCVAMVSLAERVAKEPETYDVYRLIEPGTCDLNAAWEWAEKAIGEKYGFLDLYLVWRRRYRAVVAEGRIQSFEFPNLSKLLPPEIAKGVPWNHPDDAPPLLQVPQPIPNSDDPHGCPRDCSALWAAATRVAGLVPPIMPIDGDAVPGDFSVAPRFQYVVTLK